VYCTCHNAAVALPVTDAVIAFLYVLNLEYYVLKTHAVCTVELRKNTRVGSRGLHLKLTVGRFECIKARAFLDKFLKFHF